MNTLDSQFPETYKPLPNQETTAIIVPGGGMSPNRVINGVLVTSRPEIGTIARGEAAADFIIQHDSAVQAFLTGDASGMKGPNDDRYKSEKDWYAEYLIGRGVVPTCLTVDPAFSSTTYQNLRNAGEFIEQHRDESPIGIVTEVGQFDKLRYFGGKLFGGTVEFVQLATSEDRPVSMRDKIELGVYRGFMGPVKNANYPLLDRSARAAQTVFGPIKAALRLTGKSGAYS